MARKRPTPEQVVNLLRPVEVGIANYLASRGAEGSTETKAARLVVAQRWLVFCVSGWPG